MSKVFRLLLLFIFLGFGTGVFAQMGSIATSNAVYSGPALVGGPNQTPTTQQNNGFLGPAYAKTACGLSYVYTSVYMAQRYSPAAPAQPTTFTISGLPAGYILEDAYLYFGVEGTPSTTPTVSITNTSSNNFSIAATQIGAWSSSKCWGYNGSNAYKADITTAIDGNGNYSISGLPGTAGSADTDGATMIVIYREPNVIWEGSLYMEDGIIVNSSGGSETDTISGFSVCTTPFMGNGFWMGGDMQNNISPNHFFSANSNAQAAIPQNFWNTDSQSVSLTTAQTSSIYTINAPGDCYSWICSGLYWRTNGCGGCCTSPPVASASGTVAICSGSSTQLSASGGVYYTWTPAVTLNNDTIANPLATPTSTTVYQVVVADSTLCSDTAYVAVIVSEPMNLTFQVTDATCYGFTNGSIDATLTGGIGPYQFAWNTTPITFSEDLSNVGAGTYILGVADSVGCLYSNSATVNEPAQVSLSTQTTNVSCFGASDGTASVTITGGTAPYQYAWNTSPPQFNALATGLTGGTYTVVVLDANNCSYTTSVTIIEPPLLVVTQLIAVNANCASTTGNGSASIVTSGGTTPYSYYWNSNPPQTTQTAINLPAGTYTGIVTDNNGCVVSGTVTVLIDQYPVADAGPDMSFCIGTGGIQVNGSASGGVSPYIYVWAPNNGSLSNPNVEDPIANPDSATTYYFYVIGANGCMSNIDSMIVTPVDLPVVDVGADVWRCENGPGNFITATVVNPVGGYSVQWNPSLGLYCDTCLTTYATPDTTTVYCAVVTSLLTGCSSDPTTLNSLSCLTYTVRPRPVADAGPDFEVCQYDSMSTCGIATSAGPLYDFAWSPNFGVNDSTLVCPNFSPPFTTWYTLVVTSNGCPSYADSVLVTVRPTLIGDAGQVRTICANDSTQLDGQYNGAWPPTAFLWSPSAGLSDSTAQTPMASPASTTWYYFTVYNGLCPSIPDSVQVIVNPLPIANAGPDLQLCNEGDSIAITGATATSGLPPYTYLWQPSSGLQDATLLNPNLKPDTTTLYTLTVFTGTAPNVCTDTDTMLIVVKPGLNLMVDVDTNTICQGQYAQLMSTAGSGSAVFTWSPSIGLANPNAANTLANPDTTVTYYLTATEHGCTSTDSIQVRVLDTPDAAFVASSTQSCGELSVAFLNLSADGSAYEWTFGDGTISNQTSPVYTYTQPGIYTVTLVALSPGGCADTLIMNSLVSLSDPGLADFRSTPEPPVEVSLPNNSTISFYDQSELAVSWTWDFGDGVSSTDRNPNHTFVNPGVYYVTLTTKTADGCENTLRKGPYSVFTPELFVPNVFTPNNDGMNDGFLTNYGGDEAFLLQIFDRWGTKYFQTTNKNEAWQGNNLNGSKATDGVYFYTLRIGDRNYSGNVTLMR